MFLMEKLFLFIRGVIFFFQVINLEFSPLKTFFSIHAVFSLNIHTKTSFLILDIFSDNLDNFC